MNKTNWLKIFVCYVVAIVLITAGPVQSEPGRMLPDIKEAIGKNDPFERVRPIVEAKKMIAQKISPQEEEVEAPDLFMETVMLKFLRAGNIERVVTNLTSSYGTVAVDRETNSLIICDTQERVKRIIAEIKKADQTPRQIMIEVVIVDVQLDDDTEIGINWDYTSSSTSHNRSYKQTVVSTLATTGVNGADFGIIENSIGVTLHAMQETKNVEILASPRVLVVSGQEAEIKTIEEIPYEEASDTSAGGSLTSTKFKEVGVTLTVKATITDDDKILITIQPEQSAKTGESIGNVPVVDTRSVSTTLLMEDDQVVVMGGLRKKETKFTRKKIPLLGDLPLVGFLFSDNKEEIKKSELLVFISPHIYKDEPLAEEQMKQFNLLRDAPTQEFLGDNGVGFELLNSVTEMLTSYEQ